MRFTETAISRRKRRFELVAKSIFGLMALAMVVPLVCIVVYLVVRAWPLLSWQFLTSNPTSGMRHGGIWSALLGTIYLIAFVSLWTQIDGLVGSHGIQPAQAFMESAHNWAAAAQSRCGRCGPR